MMRFKNCFECLIPLLMLIPPVFGQVIDESIARELGLVRSGTPANASGSTHRVVELNVGQMRELVFPEQGELNIKRKDQAYFDILNANNSLFITPKQTLKEPVVGIFVLNQSKRSYVLNFKTVNTTVNQNTMVIGTPVKAVMIDQSTPTIKRLPVPGLGPRQKRTEYDIYVELAAFGSRSAYAPERVILPPKGIQQVTLPRQIKGLSTLLRDKRLRVKPLSAWSKKGVYLTILEIQNTASEALQLSPDLVRGQFVAKAFEHNLIGIDESNQYTALYVISQQPFEQALWR